MGLVHIYCGKGKGKTTAAAGLALRMAGSGKRVVVVRFLKHEDSGEVGALRQLPGVEVLPSTEYFGFTWQMTEEDKVKAKTYYGKQMETAWEKARAACKKACGEREAGNCEGREAENCGEGEAGNCGEREAENCGEREAGNCGKREAGASALKEEESAGQGEPEVLLILDEALAALEHGLLALSAVTDFLDHRPENLEVVLTGRQAPKEILSRADYVTEMNPVRHPYEKGISARKGIEY